MIAARNSLLMSGAKLPYDAEVEYLESTGTQWIDTGVPICGGMRVQTHFVPTQTLTRAAAIFGARFGLPAGAGYAFFSDANSQPISEYAGQLVSQHAGFVKGTDFVIDKNKNVCKWTENGTAYTLTHNEVTTTWITKLALFGRMASNNKIGALIHGQMYYLKLFVDDILVRDFIPVRVGNGSSTVGYMYDRANPTGGPLGNGLYGNAGTGAFVIGPDK